MMMGRRYRVFLRLVKFLLSTTILLDTVRLLHAFNYAYPSAFVVSLWNGGGENKLNIINIHKYETSLMRRNLIKCDRNEQQKQYTWRYQPNSLVLLNARRKKQSSDEVNKNDNKETMSSNSANSWEMKNSEVITDKIRGIDYDSTADDDDEEWIPDQVKAQQRKQQRTIPVERDIVDDRRRSVKTNIKPSTDPTDATNTRSSPYTDDEEELIEAMGGRASSTGVGQVSKRQDGYLGDCTIQEISFDYSVPVSYLADVLCTWGVPIPINVQDRLGDLVTGEQAFAIVEAVNTLDVATLYDRYSNNNLLQLCYEYDINIQDAFSFCIAEQYNLPFGVQTCLRVEQENELLRVLASASDNNNYSDDEYDD